MSSDNQLPALPILQKWVHMEQALIAEAAQAGRSCSPKQLEAAKTLFYIGFVKGAAFGIDANSTTLQVLADEFKVFMNGKASELGIDQRLEA